MQCFSQMQKRSVEWREPIKFKALFGKLKRPKARKMIWFFNDENYFAQNPKHNRRNDRWLAQSPFLVPRKETVKNPASVMDS